MLNHHLKETETIGKNILELLKEKVIKTSKLMKKLVSVMVVVVIIVASLTTASAAYLGTVMCNSTAVHVRTGAGTDYPSYGCMYYGEYFQAERYENGWYYGYPTQSSALYKAYGIFRGYTYESYYIEF